MKSTAIKIMDVGKLKSVILLMAIVLLPVFVHSQSNEIKTDTVYYNSKSKKIRSITVTEGNKKTFSSFYQNGSRESLEYYVDNKLEGKRSSWYQNGEKLADEIFSKGQCIKRIKWYQSGILENEENYKLVRKDTFWISVQEGKYLHNNVSGSRASEGYLKEGKKNGKWTEYYDNRRKKSVVNYKAGIKDGKATYWSQGGKKSGEYNYTTEIKKDKPHEIMHGKQMKYYDNGRKEEESNYKLGKKEGISKEWYANGKIKSEIEYKNGLNDGINRRWFENGRMKQNIRQIQVYDSIKKRNHQFNDGKYEIFYDNGNLEKSGNYIQGKENGLFLNFYDNGQKSSELNYKNGLKTGKSTGWFRNGNISQSESFIIITDENKVLKSVNDGEFSRYVENNIMVEKGMFKSGKKDGLWAQWYEDGVKAEETVYCKGLPCGKSTAWYKDGSPKFEKSYIVLVQDNKEQSFPDGEEKHYSDKGIITSINYYSKGKCYKSENFYEEGGLKTSISHFIKPEYSHSPEYGRYTHFFSNGELENDAFYFKGAKGRSVNYYMNGNLKSVTDIGAKDTNEQYGFQLQWSSDGELQDFRRYTSHKDFEVINNQGLGASLYQSYMNRPIDEGQRKEGKKEGLWIIWFEKDHKQFEENYKNGKLEGMFIAYYPDGKKMFEMEMKEGIANGKFTLWNPDGNKNMEGNYQEGLQSGARTYYYKNGKKHEEFVYVAGKKQWVSRREWYQNGFQKLEENQSNGRDSGLFNYWYENGQLKTTYVKNNESLEGPLKSFYEDGKLKSEKNFLKNKQEGEEIFYYTTGQKERTLYYKEGKKNGKYTRWWQNGQLHTEGFYLNDKSDSTWIFYSESDGSVDRRNIYKNGILQRAASGLACECVDSTITKIGYAPLLSDLASLENVRKMSFNFHAPIGEFYNDLFFINLFTGAGNKSSSYSFDIISFEEISLQVPDRSGIKLILNPCRSLERWQSKTHFSIDIEKDNKENTSAILYTDHLSIEFNSRLLHQWDKKRSVPMQTNTTESTGSVSLVPAVLLFKAKSLSYNSTHHMEVSDVKDPCFTTSEIGNSGILLDFKDIVVDLDVTRNPEMMDWYMPAKYYDYYYDYDGEETGYKNRNQRGRSSGKVKETFTGVFVPEARIALPKDLFGLKDTVITQARNIMISGNYIAGTIRFKASLSDGLNYQIESKGEKSVFNTISLENKFIEKGFRKIKTEYDTKTSEFIIYFYYTITNDY